MNLNKLKSGQQRRLLVAILVNALLTIISLLLGLVVVEVSLRYLAPTGSDYHVWPPYMTHNFYPDEDRFPGISGMSEFRVNSRGLRADELTPDHDYRILAVGGSTTECLALDQEEAWPKLLQRYLDASGKLGKIWVGNAGKSGHSTREHLFQVRRLLQQYPQLDLLILLVGVNDLGLRLSQDRNYDPHILDRKGIEEIMLPRAFSLIPIRVSHNLPFYKRTEIYHKLRTVKNYFQSLLILRDHVQDTELYVYDRWRELRKNAHNIVEEAPNLSSALDEYQRNLESIVSIAQQYGTRVLLITQPSMWHEDLSQFERNLLWWGGIGDYREDSEDRDYYSVSVLAQAMSMYNNRLIDVCREKEANCLDLAPLLPKNASVFIDGVHFNESGAVLVARHIADYILAMKRD